MERIASRRRMMKILPRTLRKRAATRATPVLPLLGPFFVAIAFILLYCGPNIPRGLACLRGSRLLLSSGPMGLPGPGADGSKTFSAHRLGGRIGQVTGRHCSRRPSWWSLDFWVEPDSHGAVSVENLPSSGTADNVRRLLARRGDPGRVDLAILQDGLMADTDSTWPGDGESARIRSLVPLYRSVLCILARKGGPIRRLDDLRGGHAKVYLGPRGSGARRLAQSLLAHFQVACDDACPDWSADEVARVMTAGDESDASKSIDVVFVLETLDSAVIRKFAESGRFDFVSAEGAEDLFGTDDLFRSSSTLRAVTLPRSALSQASELPSRDVTTIEAQTILASSSDLPDWDAYQVARTLTEHFKELGLGPEPAEPVPPWDPGASFDYPVHPGAARYYRRRERAESFPYQVLVVAIGASVALVVYWQGLVMKWRADRIGEHVDIALLRHHEDPSQVLRRLDAARLRAVLLYREGRINKEGFERICEHIRVLGEVFQAQPQPRSMNSRCRCSEVMPEFRPIEGRTGYASSATVPEDHSGSRV
jgi:TRAP-type uncharacterized transport system substrate-binding protein